MYAWYDYIVWESYRNGHWQLWSSKVYQNVGSISEDEKKNSFITSHPNPFSHETTIKFTLDTRSDVVIDIYNNHGMYIRSIASKSLDAGKHQLRWNADGMAAGMYIIKMNVGDKMYSTKVIKTDR
jgi:flagellar hook assembly protein FlgD